MSFVLSPKALDTTGDNHAHSGAFVGRSIGWLSEQLVSVSVEAVESEFICSTGATKSEQSQQPQQNKIKQNNSTQYKDSLSSYHHSLTLFYIYKYI